MTLAWPRRSVLLAAGGLAVLGSPRPVRATAAPLRLLVAGAPGGRLAGWAGVLAAALQRAWPGGGAVTLDLQGGEDGVTGANQFEAAGPLDATALLLPGAAAASWLAGDPRVQFDAARWVPLLCGVAGGMLAGRRQLVDARARTPLRLAIAGPLGPGAACLLGLDLLGVPARPVAQRGAADADAAAVLRSGRADAAFMADGLALAMAAGAAPLLTLGWPALAPDGAAAVAPSLADWLAGAALTDRMLLAGWSAAAGAAQLEYALVLSALTDAASVALWRAAASRAMLDPALSAAARPDARSLGGPDCGAVFATIATSSAALLAYRRWLTARLGYQAG